MSDRSESGPRTPESLLGLLDEIRSIAQNGLCYTQDHYDRARYERLLEIAAGDYSRISGLPADLVMDRFRAEIGQITPKLGVDAAIFNREGAMLLIRRSDDGLWCLPCGWVEVGESPEAAIVREVKEETGLDVEVCDEIDVFYRPAGEHQCVHSGCFILFRCAPIGGELTPTDEAAEVGFFDHRTIAEWHRDHQERAEAAFRYFGLDEVIDDFDRLRRLMSVASHRFRPGGREWN